MAASTVTVTFEGTSACCFTVLKPAMLKVIVYVPGRTSTIV